MPTDPNIERYYTELNDLIKFGGSDNELSIRKAFQNWLSQHRSNHRENLKLIPELAGPGGIPDGTVKDSRRIASGYWEAIDTNAPNRIVANVRKSCGFSGFDFRIVFAPWIRTRCRIES